MEPGIKMTALMLQLVAFCTLLPLFAQAMTESGVLYLDEITYKKIIDGSRDVLLRFEKDYVWGDDHDEFKAVAKRVGESVQPMLVATIPVAKREFEPKNVDVAVRYGADDDTQYPTYVLFKKGVNWRGSPLRYPANAPKKAANLLSWFSHHTDAFFGLKGQIKALHTLAHALMVAGDPEARKVVAERAAAEAAQITEDELLDAAKYYVKVFSKTADDISFPLAESKRVAGLLGGQMSDVKRAALNVKLNILASFGVYSPSRTPKTEL